VPRFVAPSTEISTKAHPMNRGRRVERASSRSRFRRVKASILAASDSSRTLAFSRCARCALSVHPDEGPHRAPQLPVDEARRARPAVRPLLA
jgi:hypothetical protein